MQEGTLQTILSALVSDFGYQKVRKSLDCFSGSEARIDKSRKSSSKSCNKSRVRKSAVSFVDTLGVEDEEKREILLVLAREFEGKQFIPNVNSARAFLEQQGKNSSRIKSRQQASSIIFKCLANLETHILCEMHNKGLFGGPKSLGVIAESIERAGQRGRL
ncbi:MAG: hypothetical protein OXD44_01075 [Gammaproteobacteria bacterium]|nr:hypothetical protein [Gammaproteobacteria bacterium]